jgi:membrane peptidoglycan carboxypeptidase
MFSKKSKGASAREMAAAYEIFGNGGVYYSPHTYTSVTDAEGNVVLQSRQTGIQAISSDTSTIMNRMMQNVVKSGTGTGAQLSNCPVAGKTGTTPDNYDRWWVGCTPEYVGAVWTGYDTPRSIGRGDNPVGHYLAQRYSRNSRPTAMQAKTSPIPAPSSRKRMTPPPARSPLPEQPPAGTVRATRPLLRCPAP